MPGSPYTDLDRPPLNARALQRALTGLEGPWTRLDLRVETGSTQADAVAAARAGEPEGLVVIAERQTAGRGRLGRTWWSPARAGIATSVVLRPGETDPVRGWPAVPATAYGWLPLLVGVALVEAVGRLTELPVALKWPNDLLVRSGPCLPSGELSEEAKCGGILAEVVPGPDSAQPAAVVVGVGLNVTLRTDELPDNPTGLPATSLQLAGAATTDRDPLLRAMLRALGGWYARWRAAGGDAVACGLREAYVGCCGTLGREVRVLLPGGEEFAGLAVTVDGDGRLVVRTATSDRPVAAGDVLHLR